MKHFRPIINFFFFILLISACSPSTIGIAFYNVENLFDTIKTLEKNDRDFTPIGKYKWNTERYQTKINNLAFVISQLKEGKHPDIFGLCELENRAVIQDLINVKILKKKKSYGIVHKESEDLRGIDVALIYDQKKFRVLEEKWITIDLTPFGADPTRDILYAVLADKIDTLHVFVNHWPSRGGGKMETEGKRIYASMELYKHYYTLLASKPNAKVIIMGDFNDEPLDQSIQYLINQSTSQNIPLTNLFWDLQKQGLGTYKFRDQWNMIDQMMVTFPILNTTQTGYQLVAGSVKIMKEPWMLQTDEKYAGYPLRTYGGQKYLGGYSDHLPISILLEKKKIKKNKNQLN
jgi:predicted extracellular nuclease